jgi:ribose transport system ATP-binding protein
MLSEDRKEEGLALHMKITENTTLSRLGPLSRMGFINLKKERAAARRWAEYLDLRHSDLSQPVSDLSGGNQQKVALARLLHHNGNVFLLDEPTRGIDVGSKVHVYRVMGELAAQGKGILFVSSYLPELLGVCDRIAVMYRGRLGPAKPVEEWDEQKIMDWSTRGGKEK